VPQTGGVSGRASTFIDDGSRLAVGVREADGIDSFFQPSSKEHCIENVKFEIIKIMTGVVVLYIDNNEKLSGPHKTFDWAACGLRVGNS